MVYKVLLRTVPLLAFGGIVSGAIPSSLFWSSSNYSTTVPHSPEEVAATLATLQLNPKGDSSGVEGHRTADGYIWTVSRDGTPMVNYIAHLEARDGGKSTKVTSEIQQLPAATAEGAPKAFKETGLATSLFNAALEEDLNPLQPDDRRLTDVQARVRRENEMVVMAATYTTTHLADIGNEMEKSAPDAAAADQTDSALRAQAQAQAQQEEQAREGVTFEPGKPMIDPSRH